MNRLFTLLALGFVVNLASRAQPNLTHVDNVNNAGNATLHWDVYIPSGGEEFVQNEIKVFDLDSSALGAQWHIISSEIIGGNWVLPTGWVMPSFLYDANEMAHCYNVVQVTVEDGIQSLSNPSPLLCSIHLSSQLGPAPGTIELSWNSPYAFSGIEAGGAFHIERLSVLTADWELIATQPDDHLGGTHFDTFTDSCASTIAIYRIRQLASNGIDWHESNRSDISYSLAFNPDSCIFLGCPDYNACNFDVTANVDDGSCIYPSCLDSLACNFDPQGYCQSEAIGACEYYECKCLDGTIWSEELGGCIVDESACGWQPDGNGDNLIGVNDLLDLLGVYGDTDYDQDGIWDSADDCVGEYDECGVCNGSGASIPIIESIEILYDSVYAEQIDEWFVFEVGADTMFSYVCELIEGCTDFEACNYDPAAIVENQSCTYANDIYDCSGNCWQDLDSDGVCDQNEIFGCTDDGSSNFNPSATADDGSCLPYVGMIAQGGIVYKVAGSTGWVIGVSEEFSGVGNTLSSVYGFVNGLTLDGYSDWSVPNNQIWSEICANISLINILANQIGGVPLNGTYVSTNYCYSQGQTEYYCCYTTPSCYLESGVSNASSTCPSSKLRVIRSFTAQ